MMSFGLDLAKSPAAGARRGLRHRARLRPAGRALGRLYFVQQRMVAARAAVSPTMSPTQQKLMQYLPVVFAVFQVFFLTGLIIYYMAQAVLRIGQQAYITRRFYGHDESLGRQAQRAGDAGPRAGQDRTTAAVAAGCSRQAKRDAAPRSKADAAGQGDDGKKDGDRRAAAERRDEAHDRAEEPPDADRARPRGAAEAGPRPVDPAAAEPRAATNAGADQRRETDRAPCLARSMNGVDDGMGRDDSANGRGGQGAGPRPARRRSPTTPSSRSSTSPSRDCSAGSAARPGCAPGSARRRCARSRIAGAAAAGGAADGDDGDGRRDERRADADDAVDRRRRRRTAAGADARRRRRRRRRRAAAATDPTAPKEAP